MYTTDDPDRRPSVASFERRMRLLPRYVVDCDGCWCAKCAPAQGQIPTVEWLVK